jgi:hypothetical protein
MRVSTAPPAVHCPAMTWHVVWVLLFEALLYFAVGGLDERLTGMRG